MDRRININNQIAFYFLQTRLVDRYVASFLSFPFVIFLFVSFPFSFGNFLVSTS